MRNLVQNSISPSLLGQSQNTRFPASATRAIVRLSMKNSDKKTWTKPSIKTVLIFFECTCYAGAV